MQSTPPEPVDEAALAAATIMQLEDEESTTSALTVPDCDPALPLHRVAEEILNGVKRQVEVQYLVHDHNSSGQSLFLIRDNIPSVYCLNIISILLNLFNWVSSFLRYSSRKK